MEKNGLEKKKKYELKSLLETKVNELWRRRQACVRTKWERIRYTISFKRFHDQ